MLAPDDDIEDLLNSKRPNQFALSNALVGGATPGTAEGMASMGGGMMPPMYDDPNKKVEGKSNAPAFDVIDRSEFDSRYGPGGSSIDHTKQNEYDRAQTPPATTTTPPATTTTPPATTTTPPTTTTQSGTNPHEVGSNEWSQWNDKKYPNGWQYTNGGGVTAAPGPTDKKTPPTGGGTSNPFGYMPWAGGSNANFLMSQQNSSNLNPLLQGDAIGRINSAIARMTPSGNYNLDSLIRQLGEGGLR